MPETQSLYSFFLDVAAILSMGTTAIIFIWKGSEYLFKSIEAKKAIAKENSVGETAMKKLAKDVETFKNQTMTELELIKIKMDQLNKTDTRLEEDFRELNTTILKTFLKQ